MDAKLSALLLLLFNSLCYYNRRCVSSHRDVAQLGRALRSGRRGRRFKSCHPDHGAKGDVSIKANIPFLHRRAASSETMGRGGTAAGGSARATWRNV